MGRLLPQRQVLPLRVLRIISCLHPWHGFGLPLMSYQMQSVAVYTLVTEQSQQSQL